MLSTLLAAGVVVPNLPVALGVEVDDTAVVPNALAAVELGALRDLLARRNRLRQGIGDCQPRHRAGVVDRRHLEHTGREVGVSGRREAVEATVGLVLGEVELPTLGVDRGGLVREHAERRPRHRRLGPGRVALPDLPRVVLLARQPCAPRRRPAGAVRPGAAEDAVGVDEIAIGVEGDGARARVGSARLAVGDVDPPARLRLERGATVGSEMPLVAARADGLAGAGDLAGGEALREHEAVGVG
jgi:hypothetical protein